MNTQQFLVLQREHDLATCNDSMSQEALQYVTVAMKSKFPAQYQSFIKEFENIAGEVYAQQQCDTHHSEEAF